MAARPVYLEVPCICPDLLTPTHQQLRNRAAIAYDFNLLELRAQTAKSKTQNQQSKYQRHSDLVHLHNAYQDLPRFEQFTVDNLLTSHAKALLITRLI